MVLTLRDEAATMEPIFIACGVLSAFGSILILLTGYLFPHMVRDRLYMKILLMISFSDAIASLAFAGGYVSTPSLCSLQGGIEIFFFRATWLWTLAMSYELFGLSKYNEVPLSFPTMNFIIWSLNIFLELLTIFLPYGLSNFADNVEYGTDDLRYGEIVCSLKKKDNVIVVNQVAIGVIFIPLCIVIVGLLACLFGVYRHYKLAKSKYERSSAVNSNHDTLLSNDSDSLETAEIGDVSEEYLLRLESVMSTLSLYPLCLLLSWMPLFVFFILGNGFREVDVNGNAPSEKFGEVLTMAFAALHGLFLSIIFFANSHDARHHWNRYLNLLCGSKETNDILKMFGTLNAGAGENEEYVLIE